ncbi:MAG: hypothetical protein V4760_07125 [Bdellovibrionota bacterium]
MQDENRSKTRRPKARDGTLHAKPTRDANWFGASKIPQEEFIENDPSPNDLHRGGNDSEGTPTFGSIGANESEGK